MWRQSVDFFPTIFTVALNHNKKISSEVGQTFLIEKKQIDRARCQNVKFPNDFDYLKTANKMLKTSQRISCSEVED